MPEAHSLRHRKTTKKTRKKPENEFWQSQKTAKTNQKSANLKKTRDNQSSL
jgi:hypothetical protein